MGEPTSAKRTTIRDGLPPGYVFMRELKWEPALEREDMRTMDYQPEFSGPGKRWRQGDYLIETAHDATRSWRVRITAPAPVEPFEFGWFMDADHAEDVGVRVATLFDDMRSAVRAKMAELATKIVHLKKLYAVCPHCGCVLED